MTSMEGNCTETVLYSFVSTPASHRDPRRTAEAAVEHYERLQDFDRRLEGLNPQLMGAARFQRRRHFVV
jgi:hypothetical protein